MMLRSTVSTEEDSGDLLRVLRVHQNSHGNGQCSNVVSDTDIKENKQEVEEKNNNQETANQGN